MQGEKDSVTLYQNAAQHADSSEVKEFFTQRAEEEKQHYNYLVQYHNEITDDLEINNLELNATEAFHPIISDEFLQRIGQNQVLFSAISTAVLLEKDAISHYQMCAETAPNVTLKAFFKVLTEWEISHYEECLQIQKDSETYYWQLNQFEPF
jgi:rubrerythrin